VTSASANFTLRAAAVIRKGFFKKGETVLP